MRTYLTYDTRKLISILNSKEIFYEINTKNGKLHINKKRINKRGRLFSTILPKTIKISPEAVGLIVGEGFIGERSFVFANSNEKAIREIIDFLKQFKVPLKFYLEISMKEKSKNFIKDSQRFWKQSLNLDINRVRLRREFHSIAKYGTIHVGINNSLIAKLLKQVIKLSKRKIENKKLLLVGYLKGIIAAEGNVNIKKKTNCVYMVRISASKKEERDHYKRCLENIGIKIYCKDMPTISKQEAKEKNWKTNKGRAGAVIISRWENFVKIFELGLLDLNLDKKQKFSKHFLSNKFTRQFLDFNYFLNKRFSMKEAQMHFNFKGKNVNRVLTLYKQGHLSRKNVNKTKFIYKPTKKYLKLYNKLIHLR